MDKYLKRTIQSENEPSTSGIVKKHKVVNRQYNEDYITYGFTWCGNIEAPNPLCVVCGEQLANQAMVPSKLIRYLKTKHVSHANKQKHFFQRLLSETKKQKHFMKSSFTVSEKALEASYLVSKLIARQKNTYDW